MPPGLKLLEHRINRMLRFIFSASIFAFVCLNSVGSAQTVQDRANLHWVSQEVEIARVLSELSGRAVQGFVVFKNVAIVDPQTGSVIPDQAVAVRDGRIVWTGSVATTPDTTGATTIDGHGSFLSPGLADMHVHTVSLSEQLLRLATGNTTVRDMDGFPWMLEFRRAISSGTLLAPTEYIGGTIITSYPLDGYSVVVHSIDEARATVRAQATCGYDFIKVHNVLKPSYFDAVADEARRSGLDLVGHIPHDITIDHAVHFGGMRTVEHLKGFINDRNLIVSDEDYEKWLTNADVWITPTFYATTGTHREIEKARFLSLPEMKYIPLRRLKEWDRPVDTNDLNAQALLDVALPAAMKRLLPLHPHWLAGTDAANYPLQVAGYALLDELIDMYQFGISRLDVLRSATTEPAAALHRSNEFGRVATGLRADFILLSSDPTKDLNSFRHNNGVMVRGLWLRRADIDDALSHLATIQAEADSTFTVNRKTAAKMVADVQSLSRSHIALDAMHLKESVASLRKLGYTKSAAELETIVSRLQTGPCYEITPPRRGLVPPGNTWQCQSAFACSACVGIAL